MKKIISILSAFFITGMLIFTATTFHAETLPVPTDSTTPSKAAKKPAAPKKTAAKKKKIKKAAAPAPKNSPVKELTKEKLISIAINKAKELGYNMEKMDIFYVDEENQKLKKYSKHSGVSLDDPKNQKTKPVPASTPEKEYPEPADKNYEAVRFTPKKIPGKHILGGGGMWIYIDKNTGKVIECVGEQ